MKITTAFIWSTIITISIIVVANILATEYRIKREKEERKKEGRDCLSQSNNN